MDTSSGPEKGGPEKPSENVRERTKHLIEEQKDVGAERLDGVARVIEEASDSLEAELPAAARYVRGAASSLHDVSASLRERRVEDLLADLGDFARRQPALFFGGAVIAGMALSRLLKNSAGSGSPRRR